MNQSFPSSEKLKRKSLIDQLFSEGKSVNQFPVKLIYCRISSEEKPTAPKLITGVSVPKKNFRKAVDRNFLKRLLRETYRKNKYIAQNNIAHSYAFMLIYVSKEKVDYNHLFSIMEKLMKKFLEKEKSNL